MRLKYKFEIAKTISYVNTQMKIRHDAKHVFLLLKFEKKTFLKFYKEYKNFTQKNRKLFNQKCESFLIKKKVEKLSYELNLFATWKIYSIVFVAQLEFAIFVKNSYNKSKFDHSDSIQIKKDIETEKSYKIEKVIGKKIKKYEKTNRTQYRIQWKKYESEYNE